MTKEKKGVIYILTNPSFPDYVKIGYADDMDARLAQLNRSECIPFAFRVYATYEVDSRLTDMKLHDIIELLNPNLRAIDTVAGKKRKREFFAMTAEDAYGIFEAMAEIHGTTDRLELVKPSVEQQAESQVAATIAEESRERAKPFSFSMVNIPIGSKITYCKDENIFCTVVDDKKVEFNGEVMSLTMAARIIMGLPHNYPLPGPSYFKYNGEFLGDIRERLGV